MSEDSNSIENNAKVDNFKLKTTGTYPEIFTEIHAIEISPEKNRNYAIYNQICQKLGLVIENLSSENPEFNPNSTLKLVTNRPIYSQDFLGKGESEILSVIERLGSKYAIVLMNNGSYNLYNVEIDVNGMLQYVGEGKSVLDGDNPNRVLKVLAELLAKNGVAEHQDFEANKQKAISPQELAEIQENLEKEFVASLEKFREQILQDPEIQAKIAEARKKGYFEETKETMLKFYDLHGENGVLTNINRINDRIAELKIEKLTREDYFNKPKEERVKRVLKDIEDIETRIDMIGLNVSNYKRKLIKDILDYIKNKKVIIEYKSVDTIRDANDINNGIGEGVLTGILVQVESIKRTLQYIEGDNTQTSIWNQDIFDIGKKVFSRFNNKSADEGRLINLEKELRNLTQEMEKLDNMAEQSAREEKRFHRDMEEFLDRLLRNTPAGSLWKYKQFAETKEGKGEKGVYRTERFIQETMLSGVWIEPKQVLITIPNSDYIDTPQPVSNIGTFGGEIVMNGKGHVYFRLPANNKQVFQKVEVLNATSTDAILRITEQKADGTTQNFTLEYGQKITNKDGKLSIKLTLPSGQILYQPFGENPERTPSEN